MSRKNKQKPAIAPESVVQSIAEPQIVVGEVPVSELEAITELQDAEPLNEALAPEVITITDSDGNPVDLGVMDGDARFDVTMEPSEFVAVSERKFTMADFIEATKAIKESDAYIDLQSDTPIIVNTSAEGVAMKLAVALGAQIVHVDDTSVTLSKGDTQACANIAAGYESALRGFRNMGF